MLYAIFFLLNCIELYCILDDPKCHCLYNNITIEEIYNGESLLEYVHLVLELIFALVELTRIDLA
jgi:hypothetical protein